MTWKAPFTINSHTPPSSSSPNPDLETDSPLSLPDCLALAGPIRSPQDLASNEPPGSSRPLHADRGQSYSFTAFFPPAKSPPALFSFINHFWFPALWRAVVTRVFFCVFTHHHYTHYIRKNHRKQPVLLFTPCSPSSHPFWPYCGPPLHFDSS